MDHEVTSTFYHFSVQKCIATEKYALQGERKYIICFLEQMFITEHLLNEFYIGPGPFLLQFLAVELGKGSYLLVTVLL